MVSIGCEVQTESDTIGVEFEIILRQVRKGTAQAIKFNAKDNVNLALAHGCHEPVETASAKLRARNRIGIFGGNRPASPLAILLQFEALRFNRLVVGRDS